jgi:hypothetical protein
MVASKSQLHRRYYTLAKSCLLAIRAVFALSGYLALEVPTQIRPHRLAEVWDLT